MKPRVLLPVLFGVVLWAHPMGKFSVSHYSRIQVAAGGAAIRHVLDLAEIPSAQLLQEWKLDGNSPREALEVKAAEQARAWMGQLSVESGGQRLTTIFD